MVGDVVDGVVVENEMGECVGGGGGTDGMNVRVIRCCHGWNGC